MRNTQYNPSSMPRRPTHSTLLLLLPPPARGQPVYQSLPAMPPFRQAVAAKCVDRLVDPPAGGHKSRRVAACRALSCPPWRASPPSAMSDILCFPWPVEVTLKVMSTRPVANPTAPRFPPTIRFRARESASRPRSGPLSAPIPPIPGKRASAPAAAVRQQRRGGFPSWTPPASNRRSRPQHPLRAPPRRARHGRMCPSGHGQPPRRRRRRVTLQGPQHQRRTRVAG